MFMGATRANEVPIICQRPIRCISARYRSDPPSACGTMWVNIHSGRVTEAATQIESFSDRHFSASRNTIFIQVASTVCLPNVLGEKRVRASFSTQWLDALIAPHDRWCGVPFGPSKFLQSTDLQKNLSVVKRTADRSHQLLQRVPRC